MKSRLYRSFFALCFSLSTFLGCDSTPDPDPEPDDSGLLFVCDNGESKYTSIQQAINAASSGSVIEVCPGTYAENLAINNKALTIRSKEGKTSTIIEAASSGSAISITGADAPGVVIEGFTIRDGQKQFGIGGGVLCRESTLELVNNAITNNSAANGGGIGAQDCTVQIRQNQIFDNKATQRGGGTFVSASQGAVENNDIYGNSAQEGGGMAVVSIGFSDTCGLMPERQNIQDQIDGSDGLMIKSNTIRNNTATPPCITMYNLKETGGGGLWVGGSSPIIENVIRENESSINGAGLYVVNGDGLILGNEIRNNTAVEDGGGVLMNTCGGRFADNLITENHSMDDAGGIRLYFGRNMLIENNVISKNTAVDASGGAKLSHSQNSFFNNILEGNQADTAGALELDNDASTVANCTFKDNRARLGAAIHAKAANDPVVIKDTVFEGNIAEGYGGAFHFENNAHTVTLTGIEAINNTASKGGAIATNNSYLDISDAVFKGNSADEAGGALFLSGFEADLADEAVSIDIGIEVSTNEEEPKLVKLRRVRFAGNSALKGGAIYATENTLLDAANLIVTENSATAAGGGMSLETTRGTLSASVIKDNAAGRAAGMLLDESDQLKIHSCIITDNQTGEGILVQGSPPAISYSDVYNNQGGDYAGMASAIDTNGNISRNPDFADDQGPDYRLKPGSPCIDAGDPDENLRDVDNTRSDMGAYAGPDGNW